MHVLGFGYTVLPHLRLGGLVLTSDATWTSLPDWCWRLCTDRPHF